MKTKYWKENFWCTRHIYICMSLNMYYIHNIIFFFSKRIFLTSSIKTLYLVLNIYSQLPKGKILQKNGNLMLEVNFDYC